MNSDIPPLPDAAIEAVRQAVGDSDDHAWRVGDLLAGMVDEFSPHYAAYTRYPRAWIIRQLSSRVGADASTLRDRECMSRFFPEPVRAEFNALTYHQLRACKSAGDEWRKYAEWAASNLPAPVAVIRSKIKNGGSLPPAWWAKWRRVQELCEQIGQDQEAHIQVRLDCTGLLAVADDHGISGDPAEWCARPQCKP